MSPTLQDGDVVLVRKADTSLFQLFQKGNNDARDDPDDDDDDVAELVHRQLDSDQAQRRPLWFYSRPPDPFWGDVVVFASPITYPVELQVKRVVALGGQRVRPANKKRTVRSIPSYSLWMEGDNHKNSQDSCNYGPVSKKLLVGQVEMIVWPLTRIGFVRRSKPHLGKAWWV